MKALVTVGTGFVGFRFGGAVGSRSGTHSIGLLTSKSGARAGCGHLRSVEVGASVENRVRCAVWGGRRVNRLFVARGLARIVAFRRRRLAERFHAEGR